VRGFFPKPDLSEAIRAIESMRGTLGGQTDQLRDGMQALQKALETGDWHAAAAAGEQLRAVGEQLRTQVGHPAVLDPHGYIQQHRDSVEEAGPGSGSGLIV
jgi:hypothetical protein